MWEMTRDIITLILIPALGWVLLVSRAMETTRLKFEHQAEEVKDLKAEVKRLSDRGQKMEVIVGKIEGQIENMSQQLSRIEKLLMTRMDSSNG
jgi:DNA anti-recombination protein RmuC